MYRVDHQVPGVQSVAASQPETGTVMVAKRHREAIKRGDPKIAHEYAGGANQLTLPIAWLRREYQTHAVSRVGKTFEVVRKAAVF